MCLNTFGDRLQIETAYGKCLENMFIGWWFSKALGGRLLTRYVATISL